MSFIIAAPSSGSGKTTITLGLLRALSRRGVAVAGAKSGPDYIDPQFHTAACDTPCVNLDAWAMPEQQIRSLASGTAFRIIEGAMGLFDGAPPDGKGATADLARILSIPVVLVVDAASMAQSVAPLVQGFARHDPQVEVAGVILNKVGSPRHEAMLRRALAKADIKVFGAIFRSEILTRPSRHLGLVQAGEMPDLEGFLKAAADLMEDRLDVEALLALDTQIKGETLRLEPSSAPKTIAIAQDAAFSFHYAHENAKLVAQGHKLIHFSPLNDDTVPEADKIILPGGYPELHAERLASNNNFLGSLRTRAHDTEIFGECGGYMTLGETLTDAHGTTHEMAGLLPLQTSFAKRKLHLGYRTLTNLHTGQKYKAHEFHYATTTRADGTPLFDAYDAEGTDLGQIGLIEGNVSGSFAHIIA